MGHENILKYGKFIVRALLSLTVMGIGAGIFFSSDNDTLKIVGSNMITAVWASHLPNGSSALKATKKTGDEEEMVGEPAE